jgi:tRNA nucleotidyltransferase (CCA-adding enzyme)
VLSLKEKKKGEGTAASSGRVVPSQREPAEVVERKPARDFTTMTSEDFMAYEVSQAEVCNVVLTHTNADFDSLAGAVALAKLWKVTRPGRPTYVVTPRGVNPLVERFLMFHKHVLPVRGFKTLRPQDIRSIGVVDAHNVNRLGPAADWLSHAENVVVYDHHAGATGDINFDELHTAEVGSVTTVLVEQLQEAGIPLTEPEATLLSLGIRADTGGLTYAGTTPRDARALVYVMEQGASQAAIAEFGEARLTSDQREMLFEAMANVDSTVHNGLKIGTVMLDTGRGFVTGMAGVAQEILTLASFDVLIMGVLHQDNKQRAFLSLIGRCSPRAKAVDLNEVLAPFKGGGHPAAAAASVKLTVPAGGDDSAIDSAMRTEAEATLAKARESVLARVPRQVTAAEMMTTDVYAVGPNNTMGEAMAIMNHVSKRVVPVVDQDQKLLGVLKYLDVVKAVQAGKQKQLCKAWMRREAATTSTVKPDTTLAGIEAALVQNGRLNVVAENGTLLGLVTRTDVLRQHQMYSDMDKPEWTKHDR